MTNIENQELVKMGTPDLTAHQFREMSSADYWSGRFEHSLAPTDSAAEWPAGDVIGLEHEYQILVDSRQVNFGEVIHDLGVGRPRLDPADLNAYRLASGAVLTADEAEAEIALSPMYVSPGCGRRLAATARSERHALQARLGGRARVEGYSTHLSVAVKPFFAEAIASLYAATFSASLMLLMDSVFSPGLLIRPRPSRLELGGEFVDGDRLAAAAVFAVGSVRACQRLLEGDDAQLVFPESLSLDIQRDDQRYGWFVPRTAFKTDLYRTGRTTWLRTQTGLRITAQTHLERCWAAAKATLVGDVCDGDLELIDSIVFGEVPLPAPKTSSDGAPWPSGASCMTGEIALAFGHAVRTHTRADFELAPVMLTWDRAVFVVSTVRHDRLAFASVPAPLIVNFWALFDSGALDETIKSYLDLPPRGRRLGRATAMARPGLYDRLEERARLLVPERALRVKGRRAPSLSSTTARRRWRVTKRFPTGAIAPGGHP
jgi:hypothetical protein